MGPQACWQAPMLMASGHEIWASCSSPWQGQPALQGAAAVIYYFAAAPE